MRRLLLTCVCVCVRVCAGTFGVIAAGYAEHFRNVLLLSISGGVDGRNYRNNNNVRARYCAVLAIALLLCPGGIFHFLEKFSDADFGCHQLCPGGVFRFLEKMLGCG